MKRTIFRDFEISSASVAYPNEVYQLRPRYLILGVLHTLSEMAKSRRYCTSGVALLMYGEAVGFIRLGKLRRSSEATLNATSIQIETWENRQTLASRNTLAAPKKIIDPDDADFVIEYRQNDRTLTCLEVLSTALYALATAARGAPSDYCRDLGGWTGRRSVAAGASRKSRNWTTAWC